MKLRITGDQSGSIIRGRAPAGSRIEAINLSRVPALRRRIDDTRIIAVAGEDGCFQGRFAMSKGELVRARARAINGALSPWVGFRAAGKELKKRGPLCVALYRIALKDLGGDRVLFRSLNPSRLFSEPGAKVLLENHRTGDTRLIRVNDRGGIPIRTYLRGRAGDRFIVYEHDSREKLGELRVPAREVDRPEGEPRPGRYHTRIHFRPSMKIFRGALFEGGRPSPVDVVQSELPDCYLASAATALAHSSAEVLAELIRARDDGRYEVTIRPGPRTRKTIVVSPLLYVRPSGNLLYGCARFRNTRPDQTPLWWPILEKALAVHFGGYWDLGPSGHPEDMFVLMLGGRPRCIDLADRSKRAVWNEIRRALEEKRPLSANTFPKRMNLRYRNTGIYPNHSYAIVGARIKNGREVVELRNPWGEGKPGSDWLDGNGYFDLELDRFLHLFDTLRTVRSSRSI